MQLEHNIDDFEKVKQDIVRSTFEIKKSKKPSRIRAKSLEGKTEEIISKDLKELYEYAKENIMKENKNLKKEFDDEHVSKDDSDDDLKQEERNTFTM